MAQRSHVPKFGNWDGDNVPYTAYFENARKEKADGIKINPNDPEQNPEAFNIDNEVPVSTPVPPPPKFGKHKGESRRTLSSESTSNDNKVPVSTPVPPPRFGKHKGESRRTLSSESTSNDKSSSSHTRTPKHRHTKSTATSYKYNVDDLSYRSVAVPKFGEWNENNPKSSQGFTLIFDQVKEEKQIAAAKFPHVPRQTTNQEKETTKKCCCCGLF